MTDLNIKTQVPSYAISMAKAWAADITAIHVIDVWHGLWAGHVAENIQQIERQAEEKIFLTKLIIWQGKKNSV